MTENRRVVCRLASSTSPETRINMDDGTGRTPSLAGSRRDFLRDAGSGLGAIALAWMLSEEARADGEPALHFPARAKRVIQVFACGGVSHVNTFDHKPDLVRHDGRELSGKGKVETFFGRPGRLMKSPFTFRRHGRERPVGEQPPAAPGRLRRRPDGHPLDGREELEPHAGDLPDELRLHDERLPLPGRLAVVRAGEREPGPADIRRPARPARAAGRGLDQLDLGLPAGHSSRCSLPILRRAHRSTCFRPKASRAAIGGGAWRCWRR